ncbi:F-box/LRR-repeat protein 14-like [Lytechinus pictus]|uniref:F-box/LRR-repeat protein 14-like n=1 Tax=Lytechinus variegatus TaxID=7654 RepID=UPI001BB15F90|nr:F-box/LRR-repeat protein 14-like [Lytechinus variegatus]XP_054752273.1 F-box/LRR-repeat protein 14-like [Lytechinus pictus]
MCNAPGCELIPMHACMLIHRTCIVSYAPMRHSVQRECGLCIDIAHGGRGFLHGKQHKCEAVGTRRSRRNRVSHSVDEMPFEKYQEETHISCLFPEVLALIFGYLDVRDKGRAAQVCRAWRDASYHRSVWRGVEAKLHLRRSNPSLFPSLVSRGIKRVQILSLRRSLSHVMQGMPNIQSLNLSGCYNLTDVGFSHAFSKEIPTLTVLNLSLCKQITDNSLWRIAQYLKQLEVLDLAGCSNITNTGLLVIASGLHKLKGLNLRSCRHISDVGIGYLAGVSAEAARGTRDLELLVLQDCQKLSDTALMSIAKGLHKLKSLNLSFCCGITDTGMISLSRMPSLRELNLRSCDNISDIGLAHLAEYGGHFVTLDASFCDKIGDAALSHISQGMPNLTNVSLSSCHITDEGVGRLVRSLHNMTTLNIGQCVRVTDKGLALIAEHLKELKCIDLYGCTMITTVGLERIMQLPCLTVLNLGLWHKR